MSTIEELTGVFRAVFADPAITLRPETTADDVDGWDSMSHVTLLLAVEDHFGVRFSPAEVMNLPNVGALAALVERKRAAKG